MTEVWIGVLIAGGAAVAGFALKRWLGAAPESSIDVGPVSQGWLTEQRTGKRDDRFSA